MDLKSEFKTWFPELKTFLQSGMFLNIAKSVRQDRFKHVVIPSQGSPLLFKVFRTVEYSKVKVVILAQDPYSNPVEAYDGLAFSNSGLLAPQPSLRNILQEVENDIYDGFSLERQAELSLYPWAEQGVLLINTALTVRQQSPGSHLQLWYPFMIEVIGALNRRNDIVWLLWGRKAQHFEKYITNPSHAIIKTAHPSPLGCRYNAPIPFLGSKCFSKANRKLEIRNKKEIIW